MVNGIRIEGGGYSKHTNIIMKPTKLPNPWPTQPKIN